MDARALMLCVCILTYNRLQIFLLVTSNSQRKFAVSYNSLLWLYTLKRPKSKSAFGSYGIN